MFVCIYVVIYFRAWYDGCGRENVRIFPGSAPAFVSQSRFDAYIKIFFNYSKLCVISFFVKKVHFLPQTRFSNEFSKHYWQGYFDSDSFVSKIKSWRLCYNPGKN